MKIINHATLSFLIVSLLVVGIFYYQGSAILATLEKTNLSMTFGIIILSIPYIALGGFAFDLLCKPYDIHLRWKDWFGLSFIANFINQLLPYRPGMAFRYFYLHKHYHITLSQFTIIILLYFLILLSCGLLFATIGWIFIELPHYLYNYYALSVILIVTLVSLIVFFKKPLSLRIFREHPFSLLSSILSLLVMQLIGVVSLLLAFQALHFSPSWYACMFMTGLLCMTMIFPVTPGNIGVLEALLGTLTQFMYNDFSLGFSAMSLYRASQWVISVLFGSFFSFILVGKLLPKVTLRQPW